MSEQNGRGPLEVHVKLQCGHIVRGHIDHRSRA